MARRASHFTSVSRTSTCSTSTPMHPLQPGRRASSGTIRCTSRSSISVLSPVTRLPTPDATRAVTWYTTACGTTARTRSTTSTGHAGTGVRWVRSSAYEFFGGYDRHGESRWVTDVGAMQPLLLWDGHLGCVTATYLAPLRRYVMCVSRPSDGIHSIGTCDTLLLEAPQLSGPWQLMHYLPMFGRQAYFVNIPSKFVSTNGTSMWLCYSA